MNNWALTMMLKALPLANFSSILLLKEQIIISVKKMMKTLVRSTQNQSVSSKILLRKFQKTKLEVAQPGVEPAPQIPPVQKVRPHTTGPCNH